MTKPLYQKIKDHLIKAIADGTYQVGDRVPSEAELTDRYNISRMTANRALKELTDAGMLDRVSGVGTFVRDQRARGDLIRIRDLAEEITSSGGHHHMTLEDRFVAKALPDEAKAFETSSGAPLLHLSVIHYRDTEPVGLERRTINLKCVPDALQADFSQITCHRFLMRTAPLQAAEHTIRACTATDALTKVLQIPECEALLHIHRRTRALGQVASIVDLFYVGSRFELTGQIETGLQQNIRQ